MDCKSGICTSLVNIRRPKTVRATKANTLMSLCHTGEERRVSQCSGHVYQLDLLLRQQQYAFNRDHYRIIVSYRYRDNFDLSYRLSIENSI